MIPKTKMIPTEGVLQAARTSWAVDDETGLYALVLEDDPGEAIALATYSFEHWEGTMETLRRVHEARMRAKANEAEMAANWETALANPGQAVPVGRIVICDSCGTDWTNSDMKGGILFGSKAICPDCEPRWREGAKQHGEEDYIRAECPEGVTFADWVRGMRGPDSVIMATVG